MVAAIIGGIAAGAAALTGGLGFAQQKKGEKTLSEKADVRGATAYGDLQSQYDQTYGDLEQSLQDQALNQQMTIARSGGTAGSQAAGQQQAINMAPQTAQQAGLAAHQGALGYADLANQYRGRQAREDVADFSATQESSGRRFGALGGGMASLGAGMMSDKRAKDFNSRVGKDIGFPEAYGDIPVPSDHRMKNMPVSDKRAKELEAENAQLKQQVSTAQGGNPWGQVGAAFKEQMGATDPGTTGPAGVQSPQAAAYRASRGASGQGQMDYQAEQARQAAMPDVVQELQGQRDATMMEGIQQDAQRELLAQDMPGIEQWMGEQGIGVPQAGAPGAGGGATRAAGATAGGGPVAQKVQEVAQLSSQQGTTPQEAVREIGRQEQAADQAGLADMAQSWHVPDAAAFRDEPRQGTAPREQSMPEIPGFSQGPAARDSAYQQSQQLAADTPKVYAETMAGQGVRAQDERRATQELKQQQASAWLRHVMDPDRESGVKKEGILSDPDDPDNPSDERSKNHSGANMKASAIFEQTPGSNFTYKEEFQGMEGVDNEEHYGIMAQDLEKTPEGATMVEEDEMGLKRVDTDRLSMANSAAINEILERLRSLDNGGSKRA